MTEIGNDISLPENDYLAILDVITKFNECETRQELKNTTQEHLRTAE